MRAAVTTPPSSPDLWAWIAPLCAALSVGTVAAMLAAVRQINPELQVRWDLPSVGVGLVAAAAAWWIGRGFWRLGRDELTGAERRRIRRRVLGGLAGLGAVVLLDFAVAAGGLPDERRRDMVVGGFLAVAVIGVVGWTLWRLARLFDGGSTETETETETEDV